MSRWFTDGSTNARLPLAASIAVAALAGVLLGVSAPASAAQPAAKENKQAAPEPRRLPDGKPNWTGFWSPVGGLLEQYRGPGGTAVPKGDAVRSDGGPASQKPPFAGLVEGGYVWGRGTLDNKSNLISQLEAVELLIKAGFKPQRTLYLVAGHDEEVGGEQVIGWGEWW